MRIRKRSGPLGLPSISTILSHSSSDPPLISTRKHEEEEEDNTKRLLHPSNGDEHQPSYQVHQTSSDLELTFIRGKNGWVCCSDDGDIINRGLLVEEKDEFMMINTNPTHKIEEMNNHKELKGLEEEEEEEDEKMIIRTSSTATKNRRSNSLSGEEEVINFGYGVPPCSSKMSSHDDPPHKVLLHERWCEGVKGFPMKKKRGSNCERKILGDEEIARTTTMEMIKQKKIMKTATNPNKKWVLHEKDSQETSSAKKNEGSRCSRINGRGWRCCQQALVGYSLCEHHSCKGRLMRSMNSARRNRSTATTTADDDDDVAKKNLETRVSLKKCHEDEEDDYYDNEEKTSTTTMMRIENKKRKKTGMVKARSISSLLGQTQVHA